MRWVLLVGFLFLGGCQRPCDRSSCDGCCAESGECVPGTSRLECGVGGGACVRCTSQERCAAARCEALPVVDAGVVDAGPPICACNTSCCLPDGSCGPNNAPDACGPAKAFCGACRAGFRCEGGACVDASCGGGCVDPLGVCRPGTANGACGTDGGVCLACGTDQACQAGACVFTRCDAANCRFGCCRPDKSCATTTGVNACGLNGDPCQVCAGGQGCVGGFCQ